MTMRRLIVALAFVAVLAVPQVALALTTVINFSGCIGHAQNPGYNGNGSVYARVYGSDVDCDGDSGVGFRLELQQKRAGVWEWVDYGPLVETPNVGLNDLFAHFVYCGSTTSDKWYRTRVWARDSDGYQGSLPLLLGPVAKSAEVQWPVDCLTYLGQ